MKKLLPDLKRIAKTSRMGDVSHARRRAGPVHGNSGNGDGYGYGRGRGIGHGVIIILNLKMSTKKKRWNNQKTMADVIVAIRRHITGPMRISS